VWVGCKAPIEAPETFDELTGFLFSHHMDEDPEALQVGLNELIAWIDEQEGEMEEAYTVGPLDAAAVDAVDDVDRSAEGLVGLAVLTHSVFSVEKATFAMVSADMPEVYPDDYVSYNREVIGDGACFVEGDCLRVETIEDAESKFPMGIKSIWTAHNQFVWVDAPEPDKDEAALWSGRAMIQRNWLVEPPDVNFSWIEVDEQLYLNAFVPSADGHWRLQAVWVIFTQDGVPEGAALNTSANNMADDSEILDEFLATL